jgi:peptidoglycan hydrolase-like protein with peptidoglycan-binding domain
MKALFKRAAGILALTAAITGFGVTEAVSAGAATVQNLTLSMDECGIIDIGVTGHCVQVVQIYINIFGKEHLIVDGRYGPLTKAAVARFQRAHGLKPDGSIGPFTKNALRGQYQYMIENSVPTPTLGQRTPVMLATGEAGEGLDLGIKGDIFCALLPKGADVFCAITIH